MTPLITILLMHVGSETYAAQFNSKMECGAALLEFSAVADQLEAEFGGQAWAQCIRTSAPSISLRPRARPIEV